MSNYPLLQQYLNGYLYQGYPDEYGDEWGALADFVNGDPADVSALQREIARLLQSNATEAEISHVILEEIRANVDVTQAGLRWRDWLTRVSDEAGRLAAHPGAA